MSDLNWYLPLERWATLDKIGPQWHVLLDRHQMTPSCDPPLYQDAMLSFLGMSTLSPHLRMAAVLAFGSAFDVDLRLALGALSEQTGEAEVEWPRSVAAAVSDTRQTTNFGSPCPAFCGRPACVTGPAETTTTPTVPYESSAGAPTRPIPNEALVRHNLSRDIGK
jgi:hypothetical protein